MTDGIKAVNIAHQRLWLLPQKAIYWQKEKIMLIADPHIGKSAHFRKNGIAVPTQVAASTLDNLATLINDYDIEHLIILGDLFHSKVNQEWNAFVKWRKRYSSLEVSLVMGNHDILEEESYHSGIINTFKKITTGPFLLTHDIQQIENKEKIHSYILSGHVHPAIELQNRGRQQMTLPCFYFGQDYGILPAFGQFTGTHTIRPKKNDRTFIIADNHILSAHKLK